MKHPLVSVIIPVYNIDEYLESSIGSLVSQSIGFEGSIEVILVNDGSTDGSGAICRKHAARYPENIINLEQRNQGVSHSRNVGLKKARGEYIHFFDGDDLLPKNFYKSTIGFLEKHQDIDFAAVKIKFFDKSIDEHPLNYKFSRNRIIDISAESESTIMHVISCVFRRDALINKEFDTKLKIAEDTKLLNEVLAEKKRYGVLKDSQYNYRKRSNSSSAIDGSQQKKDYYLVTPGLAYESMANAWTTDGRLHSYMQNLLLYDFSYRITGAPYELLTAKEENKYAKSMLGLLKKIEPENIENSQWYSEKQKQYLLSVRQNQSLDKFGFVDNETKDVEGAKHPILNILFNWRFERAAEQFRRLGRYNLTQLSLKARLVEYAKPWLIMGEAIIDIPRALILRSAYLLAKSSKSWELWLISDRPTAAGDNGEALFRYIQTQSPKADVYFVLSKKSSDFDRLTQIGQTIDYGSWNYLVKFLLADKIISSHADIETTNPFIRNVDHYQDLIHHDFIFLQHEVISNDLSGWLNKRNKNIKLFITSSKTERDSIVDNPAYGYSDKEVKITGLARWDLLENNPQNKLIIAPTFRASLLKTGLRKDGTRVYDPTFKQSEYFQFYDRLVHDEQLNKVLKDKNMSGEFYVHPNFAQQISDFKSSKYFKVTQFPYNYQKAISDGNLLVSDYSSIPYDFAYLGKPVIYTQFDEKQFYHGHSYTKGYFFSYEKDGFGPVCHGYESTIEAIIKSINNGCQSEPKYNERASQYFVYRDKNNCQRIYSALLGKD